MFAKTIVLPADAYDTLELAAMEYGGVGSGRWFKKLDWNTNDPSCPVCINGLGIVAGLSLYQPEWVTLSGQETDCPTGLSPQQNDFAVRRLIEQGRYTVGADGIERVTWADYCEELNIIRGS